MRDAASKAVDGLKAGRRLPEGAPRPLALMLLSLVVAGAAAAGLLPRWPGTLHFVALPPLDLMADMRALLIYSPSIPIFMLGLMTSLAIRSAALAWALGGLDRRRFGYALRFYLVVLPFSALAAGMFYAAGAVLFYGLFWFGLITALTLVAFTAAAPWMVSGSVGASFAVAARGLFRSGTVGAYLLTLTVLAYIADRTSPVGPVALVPVSAVMTLSAGYVLRVNPGLRVFRRFAALLAVAGLSALILVAELGPAGPPRGPVPENPLEGSIMLMSGIDSLSGSGAILEIDPHFMGWTCERTFYYSYAGPGDGQPQRVAKCPINHGAPYEREDTLRSTEQLVSFMEAQTRAMSAPGTVAGHSQGVWLVWEAATQNRLPNVESVVLVGAFPRNPIPYPEWDAAGPGRVGRRALSLIEGAARPGGTSVFKADSPLGREWLGHPDAIENTLAEPLPSGLSALNVPSVFDLPLIPEGHRIAGAIEACPIPVIHPNLPYSAEFQRNVTAFVTDEDPTGCPFWRAQIGPLFHHFSAVAPDL